MEVFFVLFFSASKQLKLNNQEKAAPSSSSFPKKRREKVFSVKNTQPKENKIPKLFMSRS